MWTVGFVIAMTALMYFIVRLGTARRPETLQCPEHHATYAGEVECKIGPSWETGTKLRVVSCDRFEPGTAIDCAQTCLNC